MDEQHAKYHITETTIRQAAVIEDSARKAVLVLAVDALSTHGLTEPIASGVMVGWVQVASIHWERAEMAAELRRIADAIEASANA